MIDEEKVKEAVNNFCKTPFWLDIYDYTPSYRSKRFHELMFYESNNMGKLSDDEVEEIHNEEERLQKTFTIKDWTYFKNWCGQDKFTRDLCEKNIKELTEKMQEENLQVEIDEEGVQKAVESFCENPYWKEVYESAPTEISRRYEALRFYHSHDATALKLGCLAEEEKNKVYEEMHRLEDMFGIEDWKYQSGHCGHNPFYGKCIKKIKELEEKQKEGQKT